MNHFSRFNLEGKTVNNTITNPNYEEMLVGEGECSNPRVFYCENAMGELADKLIDEIQNGKLGFVKGVGGRKCSYVRAACRGSDTMSDEDGSYSAFLPIGKNGRHKHEMFEMEPTEIEFLNLVNSLVSKAVAHSFGRNVEIDYNTMHYLLDKDMPYNCHDDHDVMQKFSKNTFITPTFALGKCRGNEAAPHRCSVGWKYTTSKNDRSKCFEIISKHNFMHIQGPGSQTFGIEHKGIRNSPISAEFSNDWRLLLEKYLRQK